MSPLESLYLNSQAINSMVERKLTLNKYEFAHRAMRLMESVKCGPDPKSCDLGYLCPAHGGDHSYSDSWRIDDDLALAQWEQRWHTEVGS